MAINARDSFSSALSLFSSLYEDMNPTDLPEGLTPDCQDVWFLPGSVSTRPALSRYLSPAIAGTPQILSLEDYPIPTGEHVGISLDANGAVWQRNPDGTSTQLTSVYGVGLQFKAENAFNKQFYAYYDATLAAQFSDTPFVGVDIPRYFDGANFWRVTQDAPGAPPTVSIYPVAAATLSGPAGGPITIVAGPSGIIWGGLTVISGVNYYTYFEVTTATPHGLASGTPITIAGSTSTPSVNGLRTAYVIVSATKFRVSFFTQIATAVNGGGGTVTPTSTGVTLSRTNSQVLATTAAAHGFQVGWQVRIAGLSNSTLGTSISSIARDQNGVVTVVTATAHGLQTGMPAVIAGVTNPDVSYNGTFKVKAVLSATSFTYDSAGVAASSTAGTGNVQDAWNGSFVITSVPTPTTFTYYQLGADDSTGSAGTATIVPLMVAGARSAVVMFKSKNGAITAPSLPVNFNSDGTNLLSLSNIPIGPDGTAQRILAFTPASGGNYYYLSPALVPATASTPAIFQPGTIINDNTSTSAIVDFDDAALVAGTQIDIEGNNLFNQIVLAPCLGVLEYQGRLMWWGEVNNIKNLINMGFDGGYTLSSLTQRAGSGANDGGAGTAWTNPNNVTSTSSYADVSLAALASSQNVLVEAFGIPLLTGSLQSLTVSFEYYATISGAGSIRLTVQLLRAGVPFGAPLYGLISGSVGSSGAPLSVSLNFPATGLTPADLNAANFGVEIKATEFEVAATSHTFIRNVQITVVTPNTTPLGWQTIGSTGGTGALVNLGNMGFGYQMTSNGGQADCLLWQGFYQDYYGAPIPQPGKQYTVRVLGKTSNAAAAGNLVIELAASPGLNLYRALIPINTMGATFQWFAKAISTIPPSPDATWNLNVYLQGVDAATVVTIDELEIVDATEPVLSQQIRASYFGNEFGYDDITGVIGLQSYTAGQVTACFEQRGTLYALTDQSHGDMCRIQNNGSTEPFEWPVDRFAQQVDCAGPSAVDTSEGIAWWAGQSGLRLFAGEQPKKLSQERQPTWNRINWGATLKIWVRNDPIQRVLYLGLPLDESNAVNEVEPMSYRSVNTALEPADPMHVSLSGKMIASDLCRKWTRWTLPLNCGAMLTENGTSQMVFGAGFGQLYSLDFSQFTDDDYGVIASYYTTYFHWNHEMEQSIPLLGLHRKIYTYLSIFITGVGNLTITPLVDSLDNPWQPRRSVFNAVSKLWEPGAVATPLSEQLSTDLDHDLDWRLNVRGDRVAFKIAVTPLTDATDAYFNMGHMVVSGRMDRVMPVRGAYL